MDDYEVVISDGFSREVRQEALERLLAANCERLVEEDGQIFQLLAKSGKLFNIRFDMSRYEYGEIDILIEEPETKQFHISVNTVTETVNKL